MEFLIFFIGAVIGLGLASLSFCIMIFKNEIGTVMYVDDNQSFYVELYSEKDVEKLRSSKRVIFQVRRKNNY